MSHYVELDIHPIYHHSFMRCAEGLNMKVKVSKGKHLVTYNEIADIFELGKQFATCKPIQLSENRASITDLINKSNPK